MKFLNLDYIKRQLRIDNDCEDDMLQVYGDVAEESILMTLQRTFEDLVEEYGEVPTSVAQAALMLTENLYKERSMNATARVSIVPYTFDLILKPYARL